MISAGVFSQDAVGIEGWWREVSGTRQGSNGTDEQVNFFIIAVRYKLAPGSPEVVGANPAPATKRRSLAVQTLVGIFFGLRWNRHLVH